eukprot:g5260.t1
MTTDSHTPRQFNDTQNRTWLLDLNVATIDAVRKATGCDLLGDVANTYEQLASDIRLFVDVLYVVVKHQCDEAGVSDEDFGRGAIRAGRAFVELFADDSQLVRGLRNAQRRLRTFGASVGKIGAKLLGAVALAASPLSLAVKAASDLEETMNKFNVVFGENSKTVKAWGDQFAGQVGRSKKQVADFLANTQDLLVPIGFEAGSATSLSKQLTALAVDLASFNNKADADVMRDLHAALTGSGEVMKKYGVIVSEAAVKQELLSQGIKNATDQQKVQARLAIIMRGTTAAQGDATRSAGTFANQMKALKASVADAAAEMGSALLPVITPLITKLSDGVKALAAWIKENRDFVVSLAKGIAIAGALGLALVILGQVFLAFSSIIGGVVTILGLIKAGFAILLSPIGLVGIAVAAVGALIVKHTAAGQQALGWLGDQFNALKDTFLAAWGGIKDAIAAGDLQGAFRIAMLTLQLLWTQALAVLSKGWIGFKEMFQQATADGIKTVMELFHLSTKDLVSAFLAIEKAWVHTTSFLADAWSTFIAGFMKFWNNATGFIAKGIARLKKKFGAKVDVDAVDREIDEETRRRNAGIDAQRDRTLAERERSRRERLAEIERSRGASENALDEFLDDNKRREKFRKQRESADRDVAAAQRELDDAIASAREKRQALAKAEKEGKKKPTDQVARAAAGAQQFAKNAAQLSGIDARSTQGLSLFAQNSRANPETRVADATEKLGFEADYVRYFTAATSSVSDGVAALAAYRPDLLPYRPHPVDLLAKVSSWNPVRRAGTAIFDITVEYSREVEEPEEEENPLARPAKIDWSEVSVQRATLVDAAGVPMRNRAGDLYDPYELEDVSWVARVQKNVAAWPKWLKSYAGAINDAPVKIRGETFAKHTLRLRGLEIPDLEEDNNIRFHALSFELHLKEEGWDYRPINRGFNELPSAIGNFLFGEDAAQPILIGTPKERPNDPVYLDKDGVAYRDENGNVRVNIKPEEIVVDTVESRETRDERTTNPLRGPLSSQLSTLNLFRRKTNMATTQLRGDAVDGAKQYKVTPANVEIGDTFKLGVNGKYASFVATLATVANVVDGLVSAWNASTITELTGITAAAVDSDSDGDNDYLTLTADTAGVDFEVDTGTVNEGSDNVTVVETTPGVEAVNEVQKIELVGTYSGGTFTLTIDPGTGNETTGAIAYNASAATVQAAIEALTSFSAGDVAVTGGPGPSSPWYVTFKGSFAGTNTNPFSVDGSSLTGNATVDVSTINDGDADSDEIGLLTVPATSGTYTLTFPTVGGETTGAIAYDATAATVQAALEALGTIGTGNIDVAGGKATSATEQRVFVIHFINDLGATNVGVIGINPGGLGGLGGSVGYSTLIQGGLTAVNEVQLVYLGAATAGTFTLADSEATDTAGATFDYDTTVAELQAEMDTWNGGAIWYNVEGQAGVYVVEFQSDVADSNRATLTLGSGGLTGATSPAASTIRQGGSNSNEQQAVRVYATGGTFTLTFSGQTTAATAWNASAATLTTNLEALSTITDVTVTGTGTPADPYLVEFVDPGNQNLAEMTADASLLTGGGGLVTTITTGSAGTDEVQTVTIGAGVTGGTFTLSFGGEETATIAYNAAASAVETALEALGTIDGLSVSGSAGGPWTITFDSATLGSTDVALLVADGDNLTGGSGTEALTVALLVGVAGKNCWHDPTNWTGGRVPDTGDTVFIGGDVPLLWGLRQLANFTADAGTDTLTVDGPLHLVDDQIVEVTNSGGGLPGGLAADTSYYVINPDYDAGTLQLSATSGGAAINITSAGTGTHEIGVQLAYLHRRQNHTAAIGLPRRHADGYFEYRERNLRIGADNVEQGGGSGNGAGRFNLDLGQREAVITVIDTGGALESAVAPLRLLGSHTGNSLKIEDGEVDCATEPAETFKCDTIEMYAGDLELGRGVTATGTILIAGGEIIMDEASRRRGGTPRQSVRRTVMPRPPIFGILLSDLESGLTAEVSVLEKVTTHEIQHVKLRGLPTGGTFQLAFDPPGDGANETTAAIAYDATAAELKAALVALDAFEERDLQVTRFPGLWLVEFIGQYADVDVPLLTVADDSVDGFAELIAIAGSQWEDTGVVETVEAVIPVGSPTPLVAGAMVAADWYSGAGYATCAACDLRRRNRCGVVDEIVSVRARVANAHCPCGFWPGDLSKESTTRAGSSLPAVRAHPPDVTQADVLLVFGPSPEPGFFEIRGAAVTDRLRVHGISAACLAMQDRTVAPLQEAIDTLRPRLLVNRAMCIDAAVVRELAGRNPGVRFVAVNHSSQSDLMRVPRWINDQVAHVELAAERTNCWFGHVDERNHVARMTDLPRAIWFPNCVRLPPVAAERPLHDPPVVGLTCVARVLKNLPNQIVAMGIANRRTPLHARFSLHKSDQRQIARLADFAGLEYSSAAWRDWSDFMASLVSEIDVGLQCSFTESFNYVGLEHMLCGKPVIGSPALRYLPYRWQANPDAPEAIADLLLRVFEDYDTESQHARTVALELAAWLNRNFIEIAPDTQRANVVAFETFQKWCLQNEIIAQPIAKQIEKPTGRKRERIPTAEETAAILAAGSREFRLIYRALRQSGARPNELCRACVENIEKGVIVLAKHKTAKKTGKARRIPIGRKFQEIINESLGVGTAAERTAGHLFLTKRGKPWTPGGLGSMYRRIRDKLGLSKDLCVYLARHEHATLLSRKADIRSVKDSLGHSSINTTMRYVKGDDEEVRTNQDLIE